ncbi:MAG: hypothetical protein HYX54_10020 [Chloroflexi bacterium]|nr:hypothetical protein [Chloroflexota bacterium]
MASDDAAVVAAIEAQGSAGLDPLTDGRLRDRGPFGALTGLRGLDDGPAGLRLRDVPTWETPLTVRSWQFAAGHAQGIVKQALPGPYTLAHRLGSGDPGVALAFARALRAEVAALADAGCVLVEVEERDAHRIGTDEAERQSFRDAHQLLLDGVTGLHCSLAIVGGNADTAGIETILAAPYSSLAVDLIDGPDNWRLVTKTPGDRGIVCGAVSTRHPSDDSPELLLWAGAYAAASANRGAVRVGLATAGDLADLAWETAVSKMVALGRAAAIAQLPHEEAAVHLDPRAIDIRSAAMGRYRPPRPNPGPDR